MEYAMEYQVPQFIEVEDKMFGPFSFRQSIYLGGGTGLCIVLFVYLPLIFAIVLSIPVAGLAGALAFYRINNKPFIEIVEAAVNHYLSKRLYLWRKEANIPSALQDAPGAESAPRPGLKLTQSKLRDLAWSLDVRDQP